MVTSQGFLGYALTSIMGATVAEIFEGPHYGSIFGTITIALIGGGAVGPWVTGVIRDDTGSYRLAFVLAAACCVISATAIWIAPPREGARRARPHQACTAHVIGANATNGLVGVGVCRWQAP